MRHARRWVACSEQATLAPTLSLTTEQCSIGRWRQIPAKHIEDLQILVRADTAGATHGLTDYCREHNMRFSVGYELTEQVRSAILQIPEDAWVTALDQDGSERKNGQVCEITDRVDLLHGLSGPG